MLFTTNFARVGKTYALAFPEKAIAALGVSEGDSVAINIVDGAIIIRPLTPSAVKTVDAYKRASKMHLSTLKAL